MPKRVLLVVIPCLNEAAHIEGVVRRVLADADARPAGVRGPAVRVVVMDGGSTDGTRQIVGRLTADHRVILLDNPGRIQSCAVNRAVEALGSQAEYVVRMDAHARYPAGYCAALLAEARSRRADSVVVRMRSVGSGGFQQAVAAAQNSRLGNGGSAHRTPGGDGGRWVQHGHHALIRVDAFRQVGGYDESFTHNEDAELDVRLRAAGFRIWLTDRTECEYLPRSTPRSLLRQYFDHGSGRARNMLKHATAPRPRQALPLLVVPAAGLALLATPAGRIRSARTTPLVALPLLAWTAGCLGTGIALAVRDRRPATALAGPAALAMHLGWSAGFWWTVLRDRLPGSGFSADQLSHHDRFTPRTDGTLFRSEMTGGAGAGRADHRSLTLPDSSPRDLRARRGLRSV